MNVQNESSIISQLERLFLTLTPESWEHNTLENNLSQIKEPLKQVILNHGWESFTSKPFLMFIKYGIQHKNWKFRLATTAFFTLLHEIAKSEASTYIKKKLLAWKKHKPFFQELEQLYWTGFMDSDLWVVECCLKSLETYVSPSEIENVWFNKDTHNFHPPPIKKPR